MLNECELCVYVHLCLVVRMIYVSLVSHCIGCTKRSGLCRADQPLPAQLVEDTLSQCMHRIIFAGYRIIDIRPDTG